MSRHELVVVVTAPPDCDFSGVWEVIEEALLPGGDSQLRLRQGNSYIGAKRSNVRDATGSLGPSNDDSPAVQIEMRAAELDLWYVVDDLSISEGDGWDDDEINGWRTHCGLLSVGPSTTPQLAGWLACEMTMHEARVVRDATAWAWDTSRPLSEQFAETAADDAAADASEPIDSEVV